MTYEKSALVRAGRPRALTLPLSDMYEALADSPSGQQTLGQSQSILFSKLSPELRLLIYEHLVPPKDHKVHILWRNPDTSAIQHNTCCSHESYSRVWNHHCWGINLSEKPSDTHDRAWLKDWHHDHRSSWRHIIPHPSDPADLTLVHYMALLKTCRRVYTEGITLLYTTPTFSFRQSKPIRLLRSSILPQRWSSIRSLSLNTVMSCYNGGLNPQFPPMRPAPPEEHSGWPRTWRAIGEMKRLENLDVSLEWLLGPCESSSLNGMCTMTRGPRGEYVMSHLDKFIFFLEPLSEIKVKDFSVRLQWYGAVGEERGILFSEKLAERLGNVPYKLTWGVPPEDYDLDRLLDDEVEQTYEELFEGQSAVSRNMYSSTGATC